MMSLQFGCSEVKSQGGGKEGREGDGQHLGTNVLILQSVRQPNTPSPQTVTEGTCVTSVCSKG